MKRLLMALDLEWYDQSNGNHVKEIGISYIHDKVISHHLIVQEHMKLKNDYCPTSPLGFIRGKSEILSMDEAVSRLQYFINGAGTGMKPELIYHNGKMDQRILLKMGIDLTGVIIHDTGAIYKKLTNSRHLTKLEKLVKDLGIQADPKEFHNAGNDAYLTLLAYLKLH